MMGHTVVAQSRLHFRPVLREFGSRFGGNGTRNTGTAAAFPGHTRDGGKCSYRPVSTHPAAGQIFFALKQIPLFTSADPICSAQIA
jgi:hypothetical protein